MSMKTVCKLLAFLLAITWFGAARADDTGSAAQPEVAQQARTQHEAPSGPFGLSYEILGTPALGQTLEVRVAVVSPLPVSYLTVEIYLYDGLVVSPLSFSVTAPPVGEPVEQTLTVTPWMEGPLRLALLVSGDAGGETLAGQLSVPIQVGERRPDPAVAERLRTTAEGETIFSLPASEN